MYTALLTAIDLPQDYDHPTIKLLPACPDRVFTLQSFTPAQREVLSLQTETSGSSNSRAKLLPCMKTRRRRSFCLTRGRGETALFLFMRWRIIYRTVRARSTIARAPRPPQLLVR